MQYGLAYAYKEITFRYVNCEGLKRLALKRLDKMPKITNTLFETTIKHMSLTHFVITSDSEILKQQVKLKIIVTKYGFAQIYINFLNCVT